MNIVCVIFCFFISCLSASSFREKKEFFNERGYLILKNFFSKDQILQLQGWADSVYEESLFLLNLSQRSNLPVDELAQKLPQSLIVVPERDNSTQVCRAEDMLSCYPDLHSFISGTIGSYLTALFEERLVLFKDKLNFKWPGGGAFPPHQDFPAYDLFGPRLHITAMVAIDPATIENGCLYVADNWKLSFQDNPRIDQKELNKGSAILPYIEGGPLHGSIQKEFADKISWTPLELSPGDVVLISSYVPHYSENNASTSSRRAMLFTLNFLKEGDHRSTYYYMKRNDFRNPAFHFATPTDARTKE